MSPLLGAFGAAASRALGKMAGGFRSFIDNFNRSNTTSDLGTPSTGPGLWSAIRGVWKVTSNQATSTDSNTTYPIAAVETTIQNPVISLDTNTNGGAGAAFWVSDSNNWWGIIPYQATNTTYSSFCSGFSQSCNGYYLAFHCAHDCIGYAQYWHEDGGHYSGQTCGCGHQSSQCNSFVQACSTYTQSSSTSAGTRYLRLIKSVGGTVSTVKDQSVSAAIASIKVLVDNAGSITGKAYSSTGQTTQTGSDLTETPSSPTKGTKHGIILAPGGWTSGTTVDSLTIEKNTN